MIMMMNKQTNKNEAERGRERTKKKDKRKDFKWNTMVANIRRTNKTKTTNETAILSIFNIRNAVDEKYSRPYRSFVPSYAKSFNFFGRQSLRFIDFV